jgi:hypothetical protein
MVYGGSVVDQMIFLNLMLNTLCFLHYCLIHFKLCILSQTAAGGVISASPATQPPAVPAAV